MNPSLFDHFVQKIRHYKKSAIIWDYWFFNLLRWLLWRSYTICWTSLTSPLSNLNFIFTGTSWCWHDMSSRLLLIWPWLFYSIHSNSISWFENMRCERWILLLKILIEYQRRIEATADSERRCSNVRRAQTEVNTSSYLMLFPAIGRQR